MDYQGSNLSGFFETNGHSILKRVDNNHKLRSFTEKEIEHITDRYSTSLGSGSFGDVYKGTLDGQRPVAVKRYKNGTKKEEFAKEVIVHSQINHKNVVRLLGFCTEENALMIVMEFICNGNLYNILHCSNASGPVPLPLDKRLDIAIQSAEAISCMHSMYSPVLHGDIKPANILLDENYLPKISDFGIARLLSTDEAQHTKTVIGCIGYVDPLFCQSGILTPKSDVYSFGVVLMEMITRKKVAGGNTNLTQCFTEALGRGKKLRQLFDVEIANDKKSMRLLEDIAKLAAKCLRMDDKMRPEMVEVADRLRMIRKALPQRKCESSTGKKKLSPQARAFRLKTRSS
jgi:pto-interacting protein 1